VCLNPASTLVFHAGYGNAAGYLAGRSLQFDGNSRVSGDGLDLPADVNPITGRFWDSTPANPNMTEEEKEASTPGGLFSWLLPAP
jgi:hypothetical protein